VGSEAVGSEAGGCEAGGSEATASGVTALEPAVLAAADDVDLLDLTYEVAISSLEQVICPSLSEFLD
jgi:hypothetical protein